MPRLLYTLIYYCLTPWVFLRLLFRARHNRAYAKRWQERLGFFKSPDLHDPIWIHTVSVGEFLGAKPLILKILEKWPHVPVIVTSTTVTGSAQVQAQLKDKVFHVYCPYDLPGAVNRFLDRIKPQLLILMETELWPNLLFSVNERKIPTYLINARLSLKSKLGYNKIPTLTKKMLKTLKHVAVQNTEDAKRFVDLGLPKQKLSVTGNIKYDLDIPADLKAKAKVLKARWGTNRPVFIVASTHSAEEAPLLEAFGALKKNHPDLLLLWVPRHPERFDKVATLCTQAGYRLCRRSQGEISAQACEVFLGDSMGELLLFYAAADIAFVGGSLIPHGGHNLLEPAALGLPIITGKHMFNFAEITKTLSHAGAVTLVSNQATLAEAVNALLLSPEKTLNMRRQGKAVIEQNRGTLEAVVKIVQPSVICEF